MYVFNSSLVISYLIRNQLVAMNDVSSEESNIVRPNPKAKRRAVAAANTAPRSTASNASKQSQSSTVTSVTSAADSQVSSLTNIKTIKDLPSSFHGECCSIFLGTMHHAFYASQEPFKEFSKSFRDFTHMELSEDNFTLPLLKKAQGIFKKVFPDVDYIPREGDIFCNTVGTSFH